MTGGGLKGIGVPFVRKNRVIVHNTIGIPINNNNIPAGNLKAIGIASFNPQVVSNHGEMRIIIATAPYQNTAPANDQRNLLLP